MASLLQTTEWVDGVAAHAGSDTVVCALDPVERGLVLGSVGFDAAWTWNHRPLFGQRSRPYGSGPRIPIEEYQGPVFLSHGEADRIWSVNRTRRLAAARQGTTGLYTEAHYWPGEGHVIRSKAHVVAYAVAPYPVRTGTECQGALWA